MANRGYGKATVCDGSWTVRSGGSTYGNDVLYAGYRRDAESGLYYSRARYYHPTLGTWTRRDPAGYVDGASLYQYVRGNPLTATDPTGLCENRPTDPATKWCVCCVYTWNWLAIPYVTAGELPKPEPQWLPAAEPPGPPTKPYKTLALPEYRTHYFGKLTTEEPYPQTPSGRFVEWVIEQATSDQAGFVLAMMGMPEFGCFCRGGSAGAKAVGGTAKAATAAEDIARLEGAAANANKLNHIFGNAEHGLEGIVQQFGSREAAYQAMQHATEAAVNAQDLTGVFETTVMVGTETITVRGIVVDGAVRIGTAYK